MSAKWVSGLADEEKSFEPVKPLWTAIELQLNWWKRNKVTLDLSRSEKCVTAACAFRLLQSENKLVSCKPFFFFVDC